MTVEYAPAPTKGLSLAVYETVQAYAGPATVEQIKELLPAAFTSAQRAGVTSERIARTLYWCVHQGFLIRNTEDGTYQIAPRSYFDQRREYIGAMKKAYEERLANGDEPEPEDADTPPWYRRASPEAYAGVFVLGVVVGIGLVYLGNAITGG